MGFQLEYPESTVLDMALMIAIREWRARLDDPAMPIFREETAAQIRMAERMQQRLRGE